jgi:glycosyltransferase involved in cell wall biosynthesis
MKITIITAVYNGGETIAETLRSVGQQDYPSIEHIIVDGGSSDSTLPTIRANSSRISKLISEPDHGVYDAFNKGLQLASGDVIAFLNCGDTYASCSVVSRMANALASSGAESAFADLSIVDEMDFAREVRRYSSKHFKPNRLKFGLMPAHPTLFLRREIYRQVGTYDTRYRIASDYEYCLRTFLMRNTTYRYVPDVMVRMPSGGISNNGWRSKMQITREMFLACERLGVRTNFAMLCLRLPLKIMEMT